MSNWKPKQEDSLRALVITTIKAAGTADPAELPHLVRQRIAGQAAGADVDAIIKSTIAELTRKGEL